MRLAGTRILFFFAFLAGPSAASPSPWLNVPANLSSLAKPIWAPSSSSALPPVFVMCRTEFATKPSPARLTAAVAFVTAQQSPFCQPDPRLATNDYGACLPHGGTSQPKLFGGYKLFINGVLAGMGPGRRVNQTQGVDVIDVTSAVRAGGRKNAIGLQGYHSNAFTGDDPRLLLHLVLHYGDGSTGSVSTGGSASSQTSWSALDATPIFNPSGSSGAWAGSSGFPHESIDMRRYPSGWTEPGFDEGQGKEGGGGGGGGGALLRSSTVSAWQAAAVAPAFVLPLGPKSALAARAVGVFSRKAALIRELPPDPSSQAVACGIVDEGQVATIGCSAGNHPTAGATISGIRFAAFGTVTGACGASPASPDGFKVGSCNAADAVSILRRACVGEESCSVDVGVKTFGEPCHRVHKRLAWHVDCSSSSSSSLSSLSSASSSSPSSNSSSSTVLIDFGLEMQGGVNFTFTGVGSGGASGAASTLAATNASVVSIKLSEELLPESCASPQCAASVKVGRQCAFRCLAHPSRSYVGMLCVYFQQNLFLCF